MPTTTTVSEVKLSNPVRSEIIQSCAKLLWGHPFSTYAVRGRGGGGGRGEGEGGVKFCLFSYVRPHKNCVQGGGGGRGRGSKMAKMLRTYYIDAPLSNPVRIPEKTLTRMDIMNFVVTKLWTFITINKLTCTP